MPIALALMMGLFMLQRRGTTRVGGLFFPIVPI
jgi:K+ transporter